MVRFSIECDGGARGNPGPAGAGVVIRDASGNVLKRLSVPLGHATNNVAEYEAVIAGLLELKKMMPKESRASSAVELKVDSELVSRQLNGVYQVKDTPLQQKFMQIWNMRVADFPNLTVIHVSREENTEADRLANAAMDASEKRSPGTELRE